MRARFLAKLAIILFLAGIGLLLKKSCTNAAQVLPLKDDSLPSPYLEYQVYGGSVHPPNILSNADYVYNDPTTVQSICPSWSQNGSATPTSLNCQAWGCTHWWSYLFGAVTTRTVYVLYYPGYGGTPRADVNLLTTELIGLLKEATIYHGYNYATLHGTFLGQDGQSYAGQGCNTGTVPDDVHIHLDGLKFGVQPTTYRVDDFAGGGVWATPCNPVSNGLLYVIPVSTDQADLYFKPFRDAPAGTVYTISVQYDDGTSQIASVIGTHVTP